MKHAAPLIAGKQQFVFLPPPFEKQFGFPPRKSSHFLLRPTKTLPFSGMLACLSSIFVVLQWRLFLFLSTPGSWVVCERKNLFQWSTGVGVTALFQTWCSPQIARILRRVAQSLSIWVALVFLLSRESRWLNRSLEIILLGWKTIFRLLAPRFDGAMRFRL